MLTEEIKFRLRMNFNPSNLTEVDAVKIAYCDLMQEVEELRGVDPVSVDKVLDLLETACMYHIKALTAETYKKV